MNSKRVLLFGASEKDDVLLRFIKNEGSVNANIVVNTVVSNLGIAEKNKTKCQCGGLL